MLIVPEDLGMSSSSPPTYHTTDEIEVAREEIIDIVRNQDTTHEEFDLSFLFHHVSTTHHTERGALGHEKNRFELDLAFSVEMSMCQRFLVILRDTLVELSVFLLFHVLLGAQPDSFLCVHLFPLEHNLLLWGFVFFSQNSSPFGIHRNREK